MVSFPGYALQIRATTDSADRTECPSCRPERSQSSDRRGRSRVSRILPLPTVRRPRSLYVRVGKPLLDRAIGALALGAAAIPMGVVAAAIRTTMGRPVMFRQQRVGRDGEIFEVLKFRTMQPCRREHHLHVINDRRQTHKSD